MVTSLTLVLFIPTNENKIQDAGIMVIGKIKVIPRPVDSQQTTCAAATIALIQHSDSELLPTETEANNTLVVFVFYLSSYLFLFPIFAKSRVRLTLQLHALALTLPQFMLSSGSNSKPPLLFFPCKNSRTALIAVLGL